MGIHDPTLADDIDIYASELLRREDPEPLELFQMMIMGGGGREDPQEPEVYVDGVRR